METYENQQVPTQEVPPQEPPVEPVSVQEIPVQQVPAAESPFANSPYECSWAVPVAVEQETPVPQTEPEEQKKVKSGVRPWLVIVLMAVCLIGAAVASYMAAATAYQGKIDRMEAAMDEKFLALKQIYAEAQARNAEPLPEEGPLSPGQVYSKNVQAVVAVKSLYAVDGGYSEGIGSGFFISDNGYVVTNCHVINGASKVSVVTNVGKTIDATLVGYDANNDVALLKVEGSDYPYATIGSSDMALVGDQVSVIGNPLGDLTATLTVGYISAKDRVVSSDGTSINMLQTDAAINSGNSGGPMFNSRGEVIGIVTAKYSGSSGSGASIEGLGFAIPIDDVIAIIKDLQEYGYVTGAYLGVNIKDVDSASQSEGLPAGAYVESVESGYAAAKAGIRAGDVIINLGGYDVDSVSALTRILRRFKAGDTVTVTVYRNGNREYLTVTLDERPPVTVTPPAEEENNGGSGFGGIGDILDKIFPFF